MRSPSSTGRRGARLGLLAGPGLALVAGAGLRGAGLSSAECWVAAVTVWCATWWIVEPVHLAVTALVPLVGLPLTGVTTHKEVTQAYGHPMVLLLLGGFVLSRALEKCGAHRRLALGMIGLTGGRSGRRVVLGFALAAFVLSMWISNTATALMLLPVALALLEHGPAGERERLAAPLLLAIAYASSLGGMTTPVGTPGNALFLAAYQGLREGGAGALPAPPMSFLGWMRVGTPIAALMLVLAWAWLTRGLSAGVALSLPAPGPWRASERRVLALYAGTAILWVTRADPAGGWSALVGAPGVGDETVALGAVLAAFLVPDGEGGRLLDWPSAARIPWELLLLVGGGVAIARGFEVSGLSATFGQRLAELARLPPALMVGLIALGVTFLTEVTSNTATTALLMPLLGSAAASAGRDPALFMVPAALSASCAFMLPVATMPNAVVYGSGLVRGHTMAREGLALNLAGVVVITAGCLLLLP